VNAWTWEHMALTRARVLFGSADARALEPTHTRPRLEANWVHTFAPSTCYPPAL
jgi:glutamine synthetase adenylyltransferase